MSNQHHDEDDTGKQPCVFFESINAILCTIVDLQEHHHDGHYYTRQWKIMNFNPKACEEVEGDHIFLRTTSYVVESEESEYPQLYKTIVDSKGEAWAGYAELLSNERHINADSEECDLKFNAVLAIMQRAVEIDLDFAINMENSGSCKNH